VKKERVRLSSTHSKSIIVTPRKQT